jgi:hypothetical protein
MTARHLGSCTFLVENLKATRWRNKVSHTAWTFCQVGKTTATHSSNHRTSECIYRTTQVKMIRTRCSQGKCWMKIQHHLNTTSAAMETLNSSTSTVWNWEYLGVIYSRQVKPKQRGISSFFLGIDPLKGDLSHVWNGMNEICDLMWPPVTCFWCFWPEKSKGRCQPCQPWHPCHPHFSQLAESEMEPMEPMAPWVLRNWSQITMKTGMVSLCTYFSPIYFPPKDS